MRHFGVTRLELLIGVALVATVAGLGLVVTGSISSREKMSNARRDVAEMGALVAPQPVATSVEPESAPPKATPKKRVKKAPRSKAPAAPANGPSSPLSALPRAERDEDLELLGIETPELLLNEPDENGPSIFLLAPLVEELMDDEQPDSDSDEDKPADSEEPPADGMRPEPATPPTDTPVQPDRP